MAKTDHARHDATAGMTADDLRHRLEDHLRSAELHHRAQIAIATSNAFGTPQRADHHPDGLMTDNHRGVPLTVKRREVRSSKKSKRIPRWQAALKTKTRTRR
jgi:hypothetical protein